MKQCILTIGVSASGKTSWAESFVKAMKDEGETWYNLSRDDIREFIFIEKTKSTCFDWRKWDKKWEKEVTEKWKKTIDLIIEGNDYTGVIISDTNLNPTIRHFLTNRFSDAGWQVKEKVFKISYEEAVKRDLSRPNPVGSSVIAEQIQKFWEQYGERYIPNEELEEAVIADIDGTVAHCKNVRDIFDFSKVHLDEPDKFVVTVVRGLKQMGVKIVVATGRNDICREQTWEWLCHHFGFEPDELFMRVTGDMSGDITLKREILFHHIAPKYKVIGALDDRPQVIMECWRPLGIQVLMAGKQNPYIWF